MELGRKGDLVAKTPFLTFPPSLGGRTVGDHFVLFASENSPDQPDITKLLQTTAGIHIAIFRFEYDSRFKRPYTATLPGNTEFWLENYFLYVRLEPLYYSPFVTVQYLHSYESKSTRKNPACGILACSCQNTSRDSRLLNSYEISFIIAILV